MTLHRVRLAVRCARAFVVGAACEKPVGPQMEDDKMSKSRAILETGATVYPCPFLRMVPYLQLPLALLYAVPGATAQMAPSTIADGLICRECDVEPVEVLRIGAREGRGVLPSSPISVKVGARGSYWLLFSPGTPPMVFGNDGGFLRRLGGIGGVPGDVGGASGTLGLIREVVQIPGDSTLIVEARDRAFLLDPDLNLTRVIHLPAFDVMNTLVLQWPRVVVFNATIVSPSSIGWPLHSVRMDGNEATVVHSFGLNKGELRPGPRHRHALRRWLLAREESEFWAVNPDRYSLTKWDSTSNAVATLDRSPKWFPADSRLGLGGRRNAPDPFIAGVTRHAEDSVWVFSAIPGEEYELAWKNVPENASGELPASLVDFSRLYRTRIDLVAACRRPGVVTTVDYPGPIISTLPGGRFAVNASEDDGTLFVSILELRVFRQPVEEGSRSHQTRR